jgi:phospholipase A1
MKRYLLTAALALGPAAQAQSNNADAFAACARIEDRAARLACFDRLMGREEGKPSTLLPELPGAERAPSLIENRWALGAAARERRFDFRPHRPSYFLAARYSDAPNTLPTSPSKPALEAPLDIKALEAKFQLSFKLKLADFDDAVLFFPGAALWGGYTAQSQWQIYNAGQSRPFRETNYEPELMFAAPRDTDLFGWRWRLLVIGLNHQSNGRAEPLSRSWNRVYAQLGFEQGNFAVLLRPWLRIKEDAPKDDNPDITRFMGYGDASLSYHYGGHSFSALGRYRPSTGKGALQLGWNFPLQRGVRGYIQAFSGYGESLIDYNVRQNTIGVGISLADYL